MVGGSETQRDAHNRVACVTIPHPTIYQFVGFYSWLMQSAIWAYPWDLLDEGVESAAERLSAIGIDEINLATNYHSVQPFLPHNPERRTFFAHASSYFQPNESHYGRLLPVPNEEMGEDDWLATIADRLAATEISLNSWTIGCHNSRLGMKKPELTLESPYGDSLAFGLCPSQPAVREYLTGLVSDLSNRASFSRIELETFDFFYGTGFGWHHDKYHVKLGTLGQFLFGLCFCDECRNHATQCGVDVDQARASAKAGIDAIIHRELPPDASAAGWFQTHSALADYVDARTETLTEVYADLRSAAGNSKLGRYAGFFEVEDAWMHGADLEALSTQLDYHTVIAYESTREDVVQRVRAADRLTPDVPIHAGVLPGHPEVYDPGTLTNIVDGLASAGVERVSFYNYGVLPEQNLDWIGQALEPHS